MKRNVNEVLEEIYLFGLANDSQTIAKKDRMRNVTPVTGEFLGFLVEMTKSTRILEIGTSNGYSTLWMAEAIKSLNGVVTTLEIDQDKARLAKENFHRSGLAEYIQMYTVDAGEFLQLQGEGSIDMVFLDSDRVEYIDWWPNIGKITKTGGLIVVDNVISHATELEPFISVVKQTDGFKSVMLPIEQGILLIMKQ